MIAGGYAGSCPRANRWAPAGPVRSLIRGRPAAPTGKASEVHPPAAIGGEHDPVRSCVDLDHAPVRQRNADLFGADVQERGPPPAWTLIGGGGDRIAHARRTLPGPIVERVDLGVARAPHDPLVPAPPHSPPAVGVESDLDCRIAVGGPE